MCESEREVIDKYQAATETERKLVNLFSEYSMHAYGWDPRDEADFDDFKIELFKILQEMQ